MRPAQTSSPLRAASAPPAAGTRLSTRQLNPLRCQRLFRRVRAAAWGGAAALATAACRRPAALPVLFAGPHIPFLLTPNPFVVQAVHRRRLAAAAELSVDTLKDVGGLLVFSALPFVAVQALADSQ